MKLTFKDYRRLTATLAGVLLLSMLTPEDNEQVFWFVAACAVAVLACLYPKFLRHGDKISVRLQWCECWIGVYFNESARSLSVNPLPCLTILIKNL